MRKLRGFETVGYETKVSPEQIFLNELVLLVETIKHCLLRKLEKSVTNEAVIPKPQKYALTTF